MSDIKKTTPMPTPAFSGTLLTHFANTLIKKFIPGSPRYGVVPEGFHAKKYLVPIENVI